jgi:hypothetical protein
MKDYKWEYEYSSAKLFYLGNLLISIEKICDDEYGVCFYAATRHPQPHNPHTTRKSKLIDYTSFKSIEEAKKEVEEYFGINEEDCDYKSRYEIILNNNVHCTQTSVDANGGIYVVYPEQMKIVEIDNRTADQLVAGIVHFTPIKAGENNE